MLVWPVSGTAEMFFFVQSGGSGAHAVPWARVLTLVSCGFGKTPSIGSAVSMSLLGFWKIFFWLATWKQLKNSSLRGTVWEWFFFPNLHSELIIQSCLLEGELDVPPYKSTGSRACAARFRGKRRVPLGWGQYPTKVDIVRQILLILRIQRWLGCRAQQLDICRIPAWGPRSCAKKMGVPGSQSRQSKCLLVGWSNLGIKMKKKRN